MDADGARVAAFLERIGRHLPRREQRESFATYFFGILGDGERKSVEPIAARASGDPDGVRRTHDRLLHFLAQSPWADDAVRREAARHAITAMAEHAHVTTWIVGDTAFLKQGKHSVGVQRQYASSVGKITNCQIGVSLSVASRTGHVPIDFALYLPKPWLDSPAQRHAARIPKEIRFKTKSELALDLVVRAVENRLPGEIVLADAAYGSSSEFRNGLVACGLDYAVRIDAATKVWLIDARGRRSAEALSVMDLGLRVGRKDSLHLRRVVVAHDNETPLDEPHSVWLVIESPQDEDRPTRFTLTTLPRRMSTKQIAHTIKEPWHSEHAYEELKRELGLDHYEGRSFPGWNHHVSVVLCCYAFLVSERAGVGRTSGSSAKFDILNLGGKGVP